MALFSDLASPTDFTAERALRVPLGVASPLWFAFASAASAGVAYWWLTRWTKPANLEAYQAWFTAKLDDASAQPANLPAIVAQPTIQTPVAAALEPVTAAAEVVTDTMTEVVAATPAVIEGTQDAMVEATAAVVDDLTRIVGIGPRLALRLNELGVNTFSDLAGWSDADLEKFDRALDLKGRAVRDAWVAQARRFAEG